MAGSTSFFILIFTFLTVFFCFLGGFLSFCFVLLGWYLVLVGVLNFHLAFQDLRASPLETKMVYRNHYKRP